MPGFNYPGLFVGGLIVRFESRKYYPRSMLNFLVTGCAGFIGFHLCKRLLDEGHLVTGIDNLNTYYDVALKRDRLSILQEQSNFTFCELDIAARDRMEAIFGQSDFEAVIHLAAQAGVRYSLENPHAYVDSNLVGFLNILEGCRHSRVKHLIFASSSSVYGANKKIPFSTQDSVDHPVSLYAATKRSNELMAYSYSHLYSIPTTGLRFFTVYGPWGRPDMALFLFTKSIIENQPINVFNHGLMKRDFTFIDDVIEGIIKLIPYVPKSSSLNEENEAQSPPYKIYNIGNNQPVELLRLIELLEENLEKKALKNMLPMQAGDVPVTYADISDLMIDTGFKPCTSIELGVEKFTEWYCSYYSNPA